MGLYWSSSHACLSEIKIEESTRIEGTTAGQEEANQRSGKPREKSNGSPTLGSMCSWRTQTPTFHLEMFGRIVLDPKIFCQLVRIRWGQRVGNERPETFAYKSKTKES
jgi:hypothetical protein